MKASLKLASLLGTKSLIYLISFTFLILFSEFFTATYITANFNTLTDGRNLVVPSSIFIIFLLLVFKTLISFISIYYLNRICYNIRTKISSELLSYYINENYYSSLAKGLSEKVRNTYTETNQLMGVLKPFVYCILDFTYLLGIVCFLFYLEPVITLSIVALCILFFSFIILYLNPILKDAGISRQKLEADRLHYISFSINYKDLYKSWNATTNLLKNFIDVSHSVTKKQVFIIVSNEVTPIIIELVIMISLLIFSIIHTLDYISMPSTEFLALMGVSVMRVLPSAKRFLTSAQKLKFNEAVVLELFEELVINNRITNSKPYNAFDMNKIEQLQNSFIDFNIEENKINFIQNESGSGKSTFAKTLAGLIPINNNQNFNIIPNSKDVAYMPQFPKLFGNDLYEFLSVQQSDSKLLYLLQFLKLSHLIDDKSSIIELNDKLSGGEVQRLFLIKVLLSGKSFWILDEPFSALDKELRTKAISVIKEFSENVTIVLISHETWID